MDKKQKTHRRVKADKGLSKEPSFMIQVGEPKVVRRDVLEALREIIIFMQSYENFKKIQGEKVLAFNQLREDLRQLSYLINNHLTKYFPRGKLRGLIEQLPKQEELLPKKEQPVSEVKVEAPKLELESIQKDNILDNLELQLKDLEKELQNIR